MVWEQEIKVGNKYRLVYDDIDEIVTVTEPPVKNRLGLLVYSARNENNVLRICYSDELFKLETSEK